MKSTIFDPESVVTEVYQVDRTRLTTGTEPRLGIVWRREDDSEVRGVWEMAPGVLEGAQGDEMFVIVSGRATVDFPDGRVWELEPGVAGITVAGDVSRWTVHETLRMVLTLRLGGPAPTSE